MLTFKNRADLVRWRAGMGPRRTWLSAADQRTRDRIALFNALSEVLTGISAVVTSWHREDDTAHNGGAAVDFRTRHYDDDQLRDLVGAATAAGLPCIVLYRGQPHEHIHCGEVATLATEGR